MLIFKAQVEAFFQTKNWLQSHYRKVWSRENRTNRMKQSFIFRHFHKGCQYVNFPVEKNKHENQPPAISSCSAQGLESSFPKWWGGGVYFPSFISLSRCFMMALRRFICQRKKVFKLGEDMDQRVRAGETEWKLVSFLNYRSFSS